MLIQTNNCYIQNGIIFVKTLIYSFHLFLYPHNLYIYEAKNVQVRNKVSHILFCKTKIQLIIS